MRQFNSCLLSSLLSLALGGCQDSESAHGDAGPADEGSGGSGAGITGPGGGTGGAAAGHGDTDSDAGGPGENCGNGKDDDGDGMADCADAEDCPATLPECAPDLLGPDECLWPGSVDLTPDVDCSTRGNWLGRDAAGNVYIAWQSCGAEADVKVVKCQTGDVEPRPIPGGGEIIGLTPEGLLITEVEDQPNGQMDVAWIDTKSQMVVANASYPKPPQGTPGESLAAKPMVDGEGHLFVMPTLTSVQEYDPKGKKVAKIDLDHDMLHLRGPLASGLYAKVAEFQGGCGNNKQDSGEYCDGATLGVFDCTDFGGSTAAGATCRANCIGLDISACDGTLTPNCGDDTRGSLELCDGTDLSGESCEGLVYLRGDLACRSDCAGLDTSGCDDGVYRVVDGKHERVGTRWAELLEKNDADNQTRTFMACGDSVVTVHSRRVAPSGSAFRDGYVTARRFGLDGKLLMESDTTRIAGAAAFQLSPSVGCTPDGDILLLYGVLALADASTSTSLYRWDSKTGSVLQDENFGDGSQGRALITDPFGTTIVLVRTPSGMKIRRYDDKATLIGNTRAVARGECGPGEQATDQCCCPEGVGCEAFWSCGPRPSNGSCTCEQ